MYIQCVGMYIQCLGMYIQCVGLYIQCVGMYIQCVIMYIQFVGMYIQCVVMYIQCVGMYIQCVGMFIHFTYLTNFTHLFTSLHYHRNGKRKQLLIFRHLDILQHFFYKIKQTFTILHGLLEQRIRPASKKLSLPKISHYLHIVHSECRKMKLSGRGVLKGHHTVQTLICNYRSQGSEV